MVNRMITIEPKNEEKLWDWVFQCWNEMGEVRSYSEHSIDSMPDCLALVLHLDGDITKY